MIRSATYEADNGALVVAFTARAELTDYGVPGSPVWEEMTDVQIAAVEICGVPVPLSDLPKGALSNMMELSDDLEWGRE